MQRISGYVHKLTILKFALNQELKADPLTPFHLKMGTNIQSWFYCKKIELHELFTYLFKNITYLLSSISL